MKTYKLGEMARILNISTKTLQRLDNNGILQAHRTITNRRYYTDKDIEKYYKTKL